MLTLAIAYSLVFFAVVAYLGRLARRQRQVDRALQGLESRLDERSRTAETARTAA